MSSIEHNNMLIDDLFYSIKNGLSGTLDFLATKAVIIASGWPAIFALDLFATPETWWKGLVYLVIFDWVAGMVRAAYRGEFALQEAPRKWYSVVGYIIVCGSAAIISNTFEALYFFQFVVYFTFFLKEFFSILRTFKLLAVFQVAWKMVWERDFSPESISKFTKEVDIMHKEMEQTRSNTNTKRPLL